MYCLLVVLGIFVFFGVGGAVVPYFGIYSLGRLVLSFDCFGLVPFFRFFCCFWSARGRGGVGFSLLELWGVGFGLGLHWFLFLSGY